MAFDTIVRPGHKVNLKNYDPASDAGVPQRAKADELTAQAVERIGPLQDLLYAEGRRSLLVILQGMDAAGKDGTVRKVFDNVNPTGVKVTCFKAPTPLELRHDFLWRCHALVPPRGDIGVFNRSYYEEVLIVRVHAARLLPPELREDPEVWSRRYQLINDFEQLLHLNGTVVIKCFLHISKEEQRQRFLVRQQDPAHNWKLSESDFTERPFWNDYQQAYEKMLAATSTKLAPWHIIPANRKWVRNYHVARLVAKTLENMKLQLPKVSDPALLKRKFK